MNHRHAWQGGECPLPEGFLVKVWFRDNDIGPRIEVASFLDWHHFHIKDIMHFEVIGIVDEYVMPWEVSDE